MSCSPPLVLIPSITTAVRSIVYSTLRNDYGIKTVQSCHFQSDDHLLGRFILGNRTLNSSILLLIAALTYACMETHAHK